MQFSLFGAEAARPVLTDLDGLLLAGGDWVGAEHATEARLSVLVADEWRAAALATELRLRGLEPDVAGAPGDLLAVRTEFTGRLAAAATRWRPGASLRVPADLELSASALRLWAIAAGRTEEAGYLLASPEHSPAVQRAGGAQLSRLGVAAVEVGLRGGPGWRVTSVKRLRRLAELLGAAPDGGAADWPVRD